RGWSDCLSFLLKRNEGIIILTVRDNFLEKVINKWELTNYRVINASSQSAEEAFDFIREPAS
ncbi:MAG: hypothetical protein ACQETA_01680, partial [Bacteroidota bacterium]